MAELVTDDEWLHHRILAEVMDFLRKRQFETTPAELMTELANRTTRMLGVADPYAERKKAWQDELVAAEDEFRKRIANSSKPLHLAVKLACIADLFDDDLLPEILIAEPFNRAEELPLLTEVWDDFRRDLKEAKSVMFIHAAAGEILADKLLIERFRDKEVTSVVRRSPVIASATFPDAERARLADVSRAVIDTGFEGLGVPLSQCSQEFRDRFQSADLVIAKGQAAYETLHAEDRTVYFFLRVKCRVMAHVLGAAIGDLVLERT